MKTMRLLAILFSALLSLVIIGGTSAQDTEALEDAYQRESRALDRELELLQQRIIQAREEGKQRITDLRGEIASLESALQVTEKENTRLRDEVDSAGTSGTAELDSVLAEARRKLDEGLRPDPGTGIDVVLGAALDTLKKAGDIYPEEGAFFLEDGNQVSGQIIHIGRMAAFGLSEEGGGTLIPAGEGSYMLTDRSALDQARTLASGGLPRSLPVYLSSPGDTSPAGFTEKTFRDTLKDGGAIGLIILALGFAGFVLAALRLVILRRIEKREDRELTGEITALLEAGRYAQALSAAEQPDSPAGRVILAAVRSLADPRQTPDDIIEESILREQPQLERFKHIITVIASVTPLLGLLGTVTGIISTFDVITIFGSGDPKLLSGGISEALVTTEFGLAAAIPLLLIGNVLTGWAERLLSRMETRALRIVNAGQAAITT